MLLRAPLLLVVKVRRISRATTSHTFPLQISSVYFFISRAIFHRHRISPSIYPFNTFIQLLFVLFIANKRASSEHWPNNLTMCNRLRITKGARDSGGAAAAAASSRTQRPASDAKVSLITPLTMAAL